jgi:HD-like signal output (HDOD) protein/ActR/RegA family two-component response regulator
MKPRILFVDDEPKVLEGLRRMLRDMRHEWDMVFVTSGGEALEVLAQSPFNVVVSDMRMPNMDGIQLLTEVRKRHPEAARIILSGQSEKAAILKSIGPTHQFLAKPCDAERLRSTLGRACAVSGFLSSEAVKRLVSQLDSLPSLPSLYIEMMEELESSTASMARVGRIISKDIGMTAKILQCVNSAFFGLQQHISNPVQAAMLLGLDTIKALVLSVHIFSQIDPNKLGEFRLDRLWNHSMNTAVFAREIAKAECRDRKLIDDAFIAGLLHDAGKLLLVTKFPQEYKRALDLAMQENVCAYVSEREILGTTHGEIGGYLLGLWGLDDSAVGAVFFHHVPQKYHALEFTALTAVHVANVLEARTHATNVVGTLPDIDTDYLAEIGKADRVTAWAEICSEISENGEQNE